jgi:ABC-2 type transport system ATP-binding protein
MEVKKVRAVIETHNLTKRYGNIVAVEGLSLRVAQGEIYAFLGLNGAGKTTTIRMLLGMVRPTSGAVWVLGTRVQTGSKRPWELVGYLVETPSTYPELTVRENLEVVRRLRPGTDRKAVDETIERLKLAPYANQRAGTLSHGNAQRLGLAKALFHKPRLLILDEPMNGLYPAGIVEIRNLLTELANEHGVTIFFSSHILSEVARLAKRISIIHRGRLLQELDAADLERHRRHRLVTQTRDSHVALTALKRAGYDAEITLGGVIEVRNDAALEQPDKVAACLVYAGCAPTMLNIEEEDLEHYFLRVIGVEGGNTK